MFGGEMSFTPARDRSCWGDQWFRCHYYVFVEQQHSKDDPGTSRSNTRCCTVQVGCVVVVRADHGPVVVSEPTIVNVQVIKAANAWGSPTETNENDDSRKISRCAQLYLWTQTIWTLVTSCASGMFGCCRGGEPSFGEVNDDNCMKQSCKSTIDDKSRT